MDSLIGQLEDLTVKIPESRDNSITMFLSGINNDDQQVTLLNMFSGSSGNMYLVDFKMSDNLITIEVLGSRTSKGRERYTVELGQTNCFTCTCKDFAFRTRWRDNVCKHVSFLICKVAKMLDVRIFNNNKLTEEHVEEFREALSNNAVWLNKDISIKAVNQEFTKSSRSFVSDELCPICFDAYGTCAKCVSCPDCENFVHKQCMQVWLETTQTCVYCRSVAFENFLVV